MVVTGHHHTEMLRRNGTNGSAEQMLSSMSMEWYSHSATSFRSLRCVGAVRVASDEPEGHDETRRHPRQRTCGRRYARIRGAKITVRFAVTEAVLGRRRSAIPQPFGWPCLNRPFEPDLTDPYREFASR